jgi:uncharacterized protein
MAMAKKVNTAPIASFTSVLLRKWRPKVYAWRVREQTRAPRAAPARRLALVAGLLLVVVGVGVAAVVLASAAGPGRPGDRAEAPAAGAGAGGPAGTVAYRLLPAGGPPQTVRLEVAADPDARARGLMGRTEVPPGSGMVFLYPVDVRESFWMKDTLVPLSIAFVAADGRVVTVAEMTPCTADPCPTYAPAGPYRYAVELRAGAFPAAGVGAGDRVVPEDPSSLPEPS